MTALYHLRSAGDAYAITKLDSDLEVHARYAIAADTCECPQFQKRQTCKHLKMFALFLQCNHVNDGFLLDWDTRLWRAPPELAQAELQTQLADSLELGLPKLDPPEAPDPQAVGPASASVSRVAGDAGPPRLNRRRL